MHTETRRRLDAWLLAADARLAEVLDGPPAPPVPHAGGDGNAATTVPLGKLWGRFRQERDLEPHVRSGWLGGAEFVQLLDFVPGRGVYENEFLIHSGLLSELSERFSALLRHRGTR